MHQTLPRTARGGISPAPRIVDFYEQRVLPVLFERLDRAFPELQWTRNGEGWTGIAPSASNEVAASCVRLHCKHPWGFVDSSGNAISWLTHTHGGEPPAPGLLVETMRKLAARAGVDDEPLKGRFTAEDELQTHRHERQRELLEAFVAYCHVTLCGGAGHSALAYLQRTFGINGNEVSALPLGLYTSQTDVREHLLGVGFSEAEIAEAGVVRDVRLDGRIIVPWRDQSGYIRKVVAHQPGKSLSRLPRQLYRVIDATEDAFGLDVALRPTSSGRDHLILVEGVLETVFFQTRGIQNVATFGGTGKVPTVQQWERLAELGVRQVTLALADDESGWERTLLALDHAYRAAKAPQVFAVRQHAFDTARGAATAARLLGLGEFRQAIARRLHGFHYISAALIQQHRGGRQWTDAELVGLLNDAIDFDACVYTPKRAWELERFFWRPILEEIGANWETIRKLLRRPIDETAHVVQSPVIEQPKPVPRIASPPPPPVVEVRCEPLKIVQPVKEKSRPKFDPLPVDLNELAYNIWQKKGCPEGKHEECWYEALQSVQRRQAAGERIHAQKAA
jgi:hypothetical protein